MNAVFLVTSSHLQYLYPYDNSKRKLVLENISQALPAFRRALDSSSRCQPGHRDALMAGSMILLQYSWELPIPDVDTDNDGWNSLLELYTGVRNIVFTFWEMKNGGSRFTPCLSYSPKLSIQQYLNNLPTPPDVEEAFGHILTCTKISHDHENFEGTKACNDEVKRLIPI